MLDTSTLLFFVTASVLLIVAPEERGRVDNEANVKFWNWSSKVEYDPTDRIHLFVRGGVFDENAITYGTAHTKASVREALRDVGIKLQSSITR